MSLRSFVIDHAEIIASKEEIYGIVIYEMRDGKIVKVWFPDLNVFVVVSNNLFQGMVYLSM